MTEQNQESKKPTLEEIRKARNTGNCPRCGQVVFDSKSWIGQYCMEVSTCGWYWNETQLARLELLESLRKPIEDKLSIQRGQMKVTKYPEWNDGYNTALESILQQLKAEEEKS